MLDIKETRVSFYQSRHVSVESRISFSLSLLPPHWPLIKYHDLHNLFRSSHKSLLARVAYLESADSVKLVLRRGPTSCSRSLSLVIRVRQVEKKFCIPTGARNNSETRFAKVVRAPSLKAVLEIFSRTAIIRTRYFLWAFVLHDVCTRGVCLTFSAPANEVSPSSRRVICDRLTRKIVGQWPVNNRGCLFCSDESPCETNGVLLGRVCKVKYMQILR